MSPFLKHAEEIFTAARTSGGEDCEVAILVGGDGAIHMLPAAGWELEPLRAHHGARAAYRICRQAGRVRLDARSGDESCVLESNPVPRLRPLPADLPRYLCIR